jgi:hypothetical protein
VLRKIFGPKRNEVIEGWRKLHNEEHHNLYYLSNIIRIIKVNEMDRACSTYEREENVYRILVGKPEERRPL